jgi:hypothetical protein
VCAAGAIYILLRMMPPRLRGDQMPVPEGYHMVDTLATLLTDQGRQGPSGSNPHATMPSVHVAGARKALANGGTRE